MCGIAGIVNVQSRHKPPELETLSAMIGMLKHRGPDGFGVYRDMQAGLAHARLSIIDLNTGDQPMTNEDGTLWIIFNGEIFNYIELRADLERRGHVFKTKSDTEVILHAFESWGNDCFERFNGQWALALWNSTTNTLVLSRDRIGVRPLYIHEHNGRVWFASEVKAIFADPRVPRRIDPRGLDQTFTYWASLAPVTPFLGIEELPPGTIRTYHNGASAEKTFWRPSYATHDGFRLSLAEAAEVLREKLTWATKVRMLRADVPVGSYLSGGLDSSVIAWMGRKAKEGDFQTFSIRFEDGEFDETSFQRLMVSTLDSAHADILVTRDDIAMVFRDVIWHAERPILRTAPAPLFLLSKCVRDHGIKAVLTGEGADEMLAGYDIFREAKIREFWSHEPSSTARPRLMERLYPYLARAPQQARGMSMEFWRRTLDNAEKPGFSHEPRWSTTSQLKRFFSAPLKDSLSHNPAPDVLHHLPNEFSRWDSLAQAQYLEVVTLLSGYLISSQGDRMLMAHSVEGRFPFLDVDVMEFCNSLPPHYKLSLLNEKFILKNIARGIIPEPIINRPKQPYRAPDASSFINGTEEVEELFSKDALLEAGIFDVQKAGGLYAKCRAKVRDGSQTFQFSNTDNMAMVGILSTQLLYNRFIKEIVQGSKHVAFKTYVDRIPLQTT